MKKIILALITLFFLTACIGDCEQHPTISIVSSSEGRYELRTVTIDNESHQYLFWYSGNRGGMTHWESCKYCKGKK